MVLSRTRRSRAAPRLKIALPVGLLQVEMTAKALALQAVAAVLQQLREVKTAR